MRQQHKSIRSIPEDQICVSCYDFIITGSFHSFVSQFLQSKQCCKKKNQTFTCIASLAEPNIPSGTPVEGCKSICDARHLLTCEAQGVTWLAVCVKMCMTVMYCPLQLTRGTGCGTYILAGSVLFKADCEGPLHPCKDTKHIQMQRLGDGLVGAACTCQTQ